MRKDGVLPRGDWFNIDAKKGQITKVYIYDEIGFWGTSASDFVKQLDDLEVDKFNLHINSPGGEIFDGLAIYNSIKNHPAEVTVHVDGLAASAASFIAQAGDKIIMARNSEMMIHDGIAFAYGNPEELRKTATILDGLSDEIADIYSQRGGMDTAYWRGLMGEELWMSGREAVDFGLADEVLDSDNEEAEKEKNKWDMHMVCHFANRAEAEAPHRVAARVVMLNNQKEKQMALKPKNESEAAPETGGTSTGDPEEPGVEVVPDNPETTPEPAPTPQPEPSQTPEPPAPGPGNLSTVLINGVNVQVPQQVASYIASLEGAQKEAAETHRQNFVEKLSDDKKIPASQVDSLTAHALSLTDEQFASFRASYESLPASSLFADHATTLDAKRSQEPGHSGMEMSAEQKKERIGILEGIVAQHERTMSEEQVKSTKSYAELQSLLGK